jgi:hypothetical protein
MNADAGLRMDFEPGMSAQRVLKEERQVHSVVNAGKRGKEAVAGAIDLL